MSDERRRDYQNLDTLITKIDRIDTTVSRLDERSVQQAADISEIKDSLKRMNSRVSKLESWMNGLKAVLGIILAWLGIRQSGVL